MSVNVSICPKIFYIGAHNVNSRVAHWYTNMGIVEGDLGTRPSKETP